MKIRNLPVLIVLAITLSACSVFRLATVQGNVLEQKQVDQIEIGMTPDQVRFLLGTPLLQDSFNPDHWDYVYYYRSPKGKKEQRTLSLYFESGHLARIVGQEEPGAAKKTQSTDENLENVQKSIDTKTPDDSTAPSSNPVSPSPVSPP